MPTLLLVEPHDELLRALGESLLAMGYRVYAARDGSGGALRGLNRHETIDLLVTEVELPDFSGLYLVDHLRSRHPGLQVLLTSWQKREHLRALGHEVGDLAFLRKPLRLRDFQERVRGLLDSQPVAMGLPLPPQRGR